MHTLANRVRIGWGNYLQVIEGVPKFMAENELPDLHYPSLWEPAFVKLLHAVEGIFDGSVPDESSGALYWCDLNHIAVSYTHLDVYKRQHPREWLYPEHQRSDGPGSQNSQLL